MQPAIFDLPMNQWGSVDTRGQILLVCMISILVAGVFLGSLFRHFHRDGIDPASLFSFGWAGGILLVTGLALPVFVWSAWRGQVLDLKAIFLALTVGLGFGIGILNLYRRRPFSGSARTLLALVCLFTALILLRLVFIRDLLLPPYTDPVEHYQIITDLLHPERPPQAFYSLARIVVRYYHFGFHALAGWVSALSGSPVPDVMLVLGQLLQAVIPVACFFPVRSAVRSDAAGLWTVLLAGLAWRMPAYASNWGKYPALTSLAVLPFALGMLILAARTTDRKQKLTLTVFALAGGFLAALSHTRSLILLAMAVGGWWIADNVLKARPGWRILVAGLTVCAALWMGYRAAADTGLLFMLAPYLQEGAFVTLLVVLLVPFGWKHTPRPMVSALLFLLFLLGGALIPLPAWLERFGYQTLLDRPFAQMVLFLPLSIIGGIGLAGLAAELAGVQAPALRRLWRPAALLLLLALTVHAFRQYGFSPSTCCQMATADDAAAYRWIEQNLPRQSVILIASNRTPTRSFGVDGGIWITPLTGYRTEKWLYNAAIDTPAVIAQICAKGVTHLYAGGTSTRFSVERLETLPGWYENQFTRPGAYIYRIIGCTSPGD